MIALVEALSYRCLRDINQDLDQFHVLVGPNASGKTTFFDVIRFLGDLLSDGFEEAVAKRSGNLKDLVWQRSGSRFELAVEVKIPEEYRRSLTSEYERCRYEIAIGIDPSNGENAILEERVYLSVHQQLPPAQRTLFPLPYTPRDTILTPSRKGSKTVVKKVRGGNDNFYDETGKGWAPAFKLGTRKSALANLPEDESKFPVSTWLKRILIEGVQNLVLNSTLMRKPSPPGRSKGFSTDGSNLP